MSDASYTRRYFSEGAGRWLADAYVDACSTRYPLGARRVRLALDAVVARLGRPAGHLVDLGCGGGDLCFAAATAGFTVTGVDVADGMIAEAEARRQTLSPPLRARVALQVADVLSADWTAEPVDAVTALGLLEYLEDDRALLARAAQALRPGGVLVVSCRNRLFNAASVNHYTRREADEGHLAALVGELDAFRPGPELRPALAALVARLREALPALEAALALDEAGAIEAAPGFAGPRRQHRPGELAAAAVAAGFRAPAFVGVHPHPLPPAVEAVAPRFYNRLAVAWEPLDGSPASLAWCSSFLAVFTR